MLNAALFNVMLPVEKEVEAAVQDQRALVGFLAKGFETKRIQIFDDKNQPHQVELLASALRLLNVSRPHLVKLLVEGALPYHKPGEHRRVRFENLMHFKSVRERASETALEELAKQRGYVATVSCTGGIAAYVEVGGLIEVI